MRKLNSDVINNISTLGSAFSDAVIIMHETIAGKAGLSGADHKYLNLIKSGGPVTAGSLALKTGLTTGAITGVIDRLEKKGLVKRVFDKRDRRKVTIVPQTEIIDMHLKPSFALLRNRMVDHLSGFSNEELEVIKKYMQSTITVMDQVTDDLKSDKLSNNA